MSERQMNHDIRDFRQPMVTSLGIMLGFLLGFLGQWAIRDENEIAIRNLSEAIVAGALIAAICMMLLVLYRLLDNCYDLTRAGYYYRRTFRLYMAAICLAFAGVAAALFV